MSDAATESGWDRLRQAQVLIGQRRLDQAQEALAAAARAAGTGADLFLAIGDAYAEIKDDGHARLYWRAAVTRAASAGVRSKANRRLATDALKRDRAGEAVGYLERYLADRPDDRQVALRLLQLRLAGQPGPARIALMAEARQRYPVLADPLLEAALVLPFTEAERAAALLDRGFEMLLKQRELGHRAVDSFIEAGQPGAALALAERLFEAAGAAQRDLSCVLRAEKAAGRAPDQALARFDSHLARFPQDHDNRVKKARLLHQMRRWHKAHEEAGLILAEQPGNIPAAELMIQALVRLDRPADARALRDRVVALHQGSRRDVATQLVALDLALADGATALERQAEAGEDQAGGEASGRIDVLMAVGRYGQALEAIRATMQRSDDMDLRSKAVQCAAALRSWHDPDMLFPEGVFRAGIGQRRPPMEGRRSVVLVSSTLAAGGAERQIALTGSLIAGPLQTIGLATHVVVRDLRPEYGSNVMLPLLAGSAAQVVDLSYRDAGLVARELRAAGVLSAEDIRLLSGFPLPTYRTIILLFEQFRLLQPEVVHLWQDGIIAAGSVAAMLAGVPRVVTSIRNVVPLENDTRRARPYLAAVYQALEARPEVRLTANSAMGARDYEEKFGLIPGSIDVIRNGIDVGVLAERCGPEGRARVRASLGIAEDEPVLGAVFRLVPAKRPHRWLEVAARVAREQPKLRMLLVGEGPLRVELEGYAAELGIAERTHFAGRQSPVEPWIAAMDTMLLSSDVEGLPNVLMEAQALGVPVVTTDAGGAREAVEHGVTGLVVQDDSVEALAEACTLYLTSETLRARARSVAPAMIAERFGVERMAQETLAAFGLAARLG